MLPRGEQLLNRSRSFPKKLSSSLNSADSSSDKVVSSEEGGEPKEEDIDTTGNDEEDSGGGGDVMVAGSHVIVLQFLKSGFVNNPVIVSYSVHVRILRFILLFGYLSFFCSPIITI